MLRELEQLRDDNKRRMSQNLHEFSWWLSQVKELKPKVGMEIGTLAGATAEATIELIPSVELFITINLLPLGTLLGPRVEQIVADSRLLSTRKKVLEILDGRLLDFLFIDGDHTIQGVYSDYASYGPLVRDGGLIGFHDINNKYASGPKHIWPHIVKKEGLFTEERSLQHGIGIVHIEEVL